MLRGDRADGRVVESAHAVVAEAGVEGDAADGRPRLRDDPVARVRLLQLALLEVRVHLDLVDRGHDRGGVEEPVEVLGHEVADPDRADAALGEQRFERPVRVDGEVEARGQRLVQDQQVQALDAELAHGLVEGVARGVVAVVAHPHLGLDHDLLARHARSADRLADLALVAVRRRGVDVPVAVGERRLDRCRGLVRFGLVDAESEGGHDEPVVERELRGGGHGGVLSSGASRGRRWVSGRLGAGQAGIRATRSAVTGSEGS